MDDFKQWLLRSRKLNSKATSDVISRLRRASKFVNVEAKVDTDDLLHKMGKHPEFKELNVYIRSQLRRAVKLYKLYSARS